jgi:hypothetical protein
MSTKRLQFISIICFGLAVVLEIFKEKSLVEFSNKDFIWGISLALLITALSFNVKIVRDFGASIKERRISQVLTLLISLYAFVIFAI